MTEAEAKKVAELVSGLADARAALEGCARELRNLPGNGGMTGIIARSTVKRITTILDNAADDPFIVTPGE